MARALLVLSTPAIRQKAAAWVMKAPDGTRLEFRELKRSGEQNDRMWATLTDIANQATHHGRKYDTSQWKCIFLQALGREMQFIPTLDGTGFLPYGNSSSELSKAEMAELIELMESWAAGNGVTLHAKP